MWNQINPGSVFAFAIILFVLLIYVVQILLRRLKYRRIAEELRAEYQSQGLFKTGEIAGSSNGRKFRIRTREITVGKSSSTWTTLSMDCINKGIPLHLYGSFFKTFPNWKYAFTAGDRKERVFVTDVTLHNAPVQLEEKYQLQVQSLFQEIALLDAEFLRKGDINIEQDAVSFTMHGVLKNLAAARQTILLLTKVADRIESEPVS